MKRTDPLRRLARVLLGLCLACDGGSDLADNGGMSGTGVSQGSITSFGSIFVNGVEWDIDGATIELDGRDGRPTDLRIGMVVRIEGEFAASRRSGTAVSVVFDDSLEGPISDDPVVIDPAGGVKRFSVLDTTVLAKRRRTVFAGGASFASLARDQVLEISGFVDHQGALRATRIELRGVFPGLANAERRGRVSNLFQNGVGGGVFSLGAVTVRYTSTTLFDGLAAGELMNGQLVEVEGTLRVSGDELDADVIEREEEGLGRNDFEDVEIEGFVTRYVSDADFAVNGVPVDASAARFDPDALVLANGVQVEVEGRFERGILIADEVEGEGDDDDDEDESRVEIEAAVSATRDGPNTLVLLGIAVSVDADTSLEDKRDGLPNFRFRDIAVGDWLEIEAIENGAGTARARVIERRDAGDDVVLRGPVTGLDRNAPALFILDRAIPIDGGTSYFDALEQARSQDEFFRNPGDVRIGDSLKVTDASAADPAVLGQADEVEIED